MFLQSIATAVPPNAFSQADCWEMIQRSSARAQLRDGSLELLRRVLLGKNGIAQRHFAIEPELVFNLGPDELNQRYEQAAPALAAAALMPALERAGLRPSELDALFVCTCTGYLCPGVSSHLAEAVGMRADAALQDLVGLGCGAAVPTLRAAANFLAAEPQARVACVAVEVCSAAFYLDDDPGVLISACLFGDGAAATVWGGRSDGALGEASRFRSLHLPEDRALLRFEMKNGKLRNRLHRSVPEKAARAVAAMHAGEAAAGPIAQVIAHAGGRDVIAAIEDALPPYRLRETSAVLKECGNMSSPSVLFALERRLAGDDSGRDLWLVSFGAGFSAHSCRFG
jgi:predicted naringenin-chalcone synthase